MKLDNKSLVFNLFNTNGRRADVLEAYQIYLEVLDELNGEWDRFPNSKSQYNFYKEALKRSPEVFKKHTAFDQFQKALDSSENFSKQFEASDIDSIKSTENGRKLLENLDKSIEARARHYTSNLIKLGFAKPSRTLTEIGHDYINSQDTIARDDIEYLLPIDDVNLILLRQLLRLRVYSSDGVNYYRPGVLAFTLSAHVENLELKSLIDFVQSIHPEHQIDEEIIRGIKSQSDVEKELSNYITERMLNLDDTVVDSSEKLLDLTEFKKYFNNKKFKDSIPKYHSLYRSLYKFNQNPTKQNLGLLQDSCTEKGSAIKRAFGFSRSIFKFPTDYDVQKFIELNPDHPLLVQGRLEALGDEFYQRFLDSTFLDIVSEYGDTTQRLLNATGILDFKNGLVSVNNEEIFKFLKTVVDWPSFIYGKGGFEEFEGERGEFYKTETLTQILQIDEDTIEEIAKAIIDQVGASDKEEAKKKLSVSKDKALKKFIEQLFPEDRVFQELLPLFSNRDNDDKIKKLVNSSASVPTIYEYVIGIAWYYISGKNFNLWDSFNLTLNGDFLPERHAAGGAADIVIKYSDKIVLLEVTLMNANSQKRGEWEPVIRHTANQAVESHPIPVYTLFIADELDENSINIWRAVASVPLRSSSASADKNLYATDFAIMPLTNVDMRKLYESGILPNDLLNRVDKSFQQVRQEFNLEWRKEIFSDLMI